MIDLHSVKDKEVASTLSKVQSRILEYSTLDTPETLRQQWLYHVSFLKQEILVPNISRRAAESEDNTLPRVHTSTSLIKCINGYASLLYDNKQIYKEEKKKYKGIYYFYTIPFEYCISPTKKLVFDVDLSDERWLFTYNKETVFFKPDAIGRAIPFKIITVPGNEDTFIEIVYLALEVLDIPLHLDQNHILKPGYYTVIVQEKQRSGFTFVDLNESTRSEFNKALKQKDHFLDM